MSAPRYLTIERAVEAANAVRSELNFSVNLQRLAGDIESLLAMALDVPLVRGRLERATWSAFEAGAAWRERLENALRDGASRDGAVAIAGCAFDRHAAWHRVFLAEDEKREDAPAPQPADDLRADIASLCLAIDSLQYAGGPTIETREMRRKYGIEEP